MPSLDNRVPPPAVMLLTGLAMGAASFALAPSPFPWDWRLAVAALPFVAAGCYGPLAVRAFGKAGTTVDPVHVDRASRLVTHGVFARTRNPMYVSMALLLTSLAVLLGQWPLLAGPVFYVLYITRFQILPEERALTARFGAEYRRYQRAVRRWL